MKFAYCDVSNIIYQKFSHDLFKLSGISVNAMLKSILLSYIDTISFKLVFRDPQLVFHEVMQVFIKILIGLVSEDDARN